MVIQYTLTGMSRTPIISERPVIPVDDNLLLCGFMQSQYKRLLTVGLNDL